MTTIWNRRYVRLSPRCSCLFRHSTRYHMWRQIPHLLCRLDYRCCRIGDVNAPFEEHLPNASFEMDFDALVAMWRALGTGLITIFPWPHTGTWMAFQARRCKRIHRCYLPSTRIVLETYWLILLVFKRYLQNRTRAIFHWMYQHM